MTICQILISPYKKLKLENRLEDMESIEECFIIAKKTNKRLQELNNMEVSPKETEFNWREEIRNA